MVVLTGQFIATGASAARQSRRENPVEGVEFLGIGLPIFHGRKPVENQKVHAWNGEAERHARRSWSCFCL